MLQWTYSILVPGVSFSFHAAGVGEWREEGVREGGFARRPGASSDVSESYRSMYREYAVYDWKRISILLLLSSRLSISV